MALYAIHRWVEPREDENNILCNSFKQIRQIILVTRFPMTI